MKRPFYHYGEGSISHGGDGTCDCPIHIEWGHHPMVHRAEFKNRRAYLRHAMANRVMHWSFSKFRLKDGEDWQPYMPKYVTFITRISKRLFGDPLDRSNITYLPVHPSQSIYGDRTEEAKEWQERRAAHLADGKRAEMAETEQMVTTRRG